MANFHLAYYTVFSAHQHLTKKAQIKCPNLKSHLDNLLCVYGLTELNKQCSALYECGYFNLKQGRDYLLETLNLKISLLRPQAINLIESIDVPDSTLNSSIGKSFGDIYETYFNNARQSRLNRKKDTKVIDIFGDVLLSGPKL